MFSSKRKFTIRLIPTGEHVRASAAELRDGAPRPDHARHRRQTAGEAASAAHRGGRAVWADGGGGAGEGDGTEGAEVDRVQVESGRQGVQAAAQPRDPTGAGPQEEQGVQRPIRAQILNYCTVRHPLSHEIL